MREFRGVLLVGVISIASIGFAQVRSVADEMNIGLSLKAEFEQRVILNRDPAILALADRVGQILTRQSDAPFPVTFQVIDSSDINVFSVTGGFVYVTAAVITAAGSEAEFASALAYGVARYSPKLAQQSFGSILNLNGALLPDSAMQRGRVIIISPALNSGIPMQWAVRERAAVEKADLLAVQFLHNAGYDAAASVSFLQSVQARLTPVKTNQEFQTYPPLEDRIRKIQEWTRTKLPDRAENALTTSEFEKVRRNLQ